jgi:hypothetical protein
MANPNIVNVTSILGNTSLTELTTNTETLIVNNADNSGKIYKINWLNAANKNVSANILVTISINDQDDLGGTSFPILSNVVVPSRTSLIVTDKSTSFYLLENQSIGARANTPNSQIVISSSWEELS